MKEGDHSLAYVGGPRFVNPIFYSLPNDVLSICTPSWRGRQLQAFPFRRTGLTLCIPFLHQYCGRARIGLIHFHVLVMQSLKNLQVVKRQHVEEFAWRLFFPISQAAVAVSLPYI